MIDSREKELNGLLDQMFFDFENPFELDAAHRYRSIGSSIIAATYSIYGSSGRVNGMLPEQYVWNLIYPKSDQQPAISFTSEESKYEVKLDSFVESLRKEPEWRKLLEDPPQSLSRYPERDDSFQKFFEGRLPAQFLAPNSKNKIRKIEAACRVMGIFLRHQVLCRSDVCKLEHSGLVSAEIKSVNGLTDVFIDQLKRLCGDPCAVKPDSRLKRALKEAFNQNPSNADTRNAVRKMAKIASNRRCKTITPAQMDHAIWKWMAIK